MPLKTKKTKEKKTMKTNLKSAPPAAVETPASARQFPMDEDMKKEGFLSAVAAAKRVGRDLFFIRRAAALAPRRKNAFQKDVVEAKRVGFYWYVKMESLAKYLGPELCETLDLTAKNRWGILESVPAAGGAKRAASR